MMKRNLLKIVLLILIYLQLSPAHEASLGRVLATQELREKAGREHGHISIKFSLFFYHAYEAPF
jgi:hypothetical protein